MGSVMSLFNMHIMAFGSFSRSVVLVIFLYLVLHPKPFKPNDIIPDAQEIRLVLVAILAKCLRHRHL